MTAEQALDKLRNICSRQEKSPADVSTYLHKWDIELELHTVILEQLQKEKFVDEGRYASAFVRDKIRFDHWGLVKIRIMLSRKGISKAVAENAIRDTDMTEYRKMIGSELARKSKLLKGKPYEQHAKLLRFGLSKGYEMQHMISLLGEPEEPANEW